MPTKDCWIVHIDDHRSCELSARRLHIRDHPLYCRHRGYRRSNVTAGKSMRVLICGGGVIGASIAYFLSCRGAEAIVIERTGSPAPRRASRAGSWRSTGATAAARGPGAAQLRAAREPAEEIGGDWGYRRLATYGGMRERSQTRRTPRAAQPTPSTGSRMTWSWIAASARRRPPPRCIQARSPRP